MANHILLVFEGAVTEKLVWESIKKYYFNDNTPITHGIYGGEIYSLFHKMNKDPDLDLFTILKKNNVNKEPLKNISRDQVSEIYLFFDYDGHASAASDEKLEKMLIFFNEETENGKLYINYPMIEAVKHISKTTKFQDLKTKCKENINYKNIVHNDTEGKYNDVKNYTKEQWGHISTQNCKKLNKLIIDNFEFPKRNFSQLEAFNKQKEKHIDPENMVAVLSAFPVFLIDYFGCSNFSKMLQVTPCIPD